LRLAACFFGGKSASCLIVVTCTSDWQADFQEALMLSTLVRLLKNEDGATAIEYGLIAALIAVAAVATMTTVGTNLSKVFGTVGSSL
jgi:pilus assembly protein Flp/PilA